MRFVALSLAAIMIATPSVAGTYSATPSTSPESARIVTKDIAWTFADGRFQGKTDLSRPMVLCQGLAKRAGRLDGFAADGRAFDPAQLAKCNAYAAEGSAALAQRK